MGPSIRPVFPKLFILLAAVPLVLDAQTAVNLSATPSPSIFGAPVVLTAAVTPQSATGRVTFYDGVTVLGSKPLVLGGASLPVSLLPAGVRHLRAYYLGDSSHAAATSPVVTLSVNAQPSSNLARTPYLFATNRLLAVADFNGDGKADIAISANNDNLTLEILVGDGAGNLTPGFTRTFGDFLAGLAWGDFNGDGIPDLAVTLERYPTASLNILLGNGDGTFQSPITHPLPVIPFAEATGDFNGDGKLDIVTTSPDAGLTVLLGQGDGTFQTGNTYLTSSQNGSGQQASYVLTADFNGDGKADLAILDANGLGILLGAGDGTFQPPVRTAGLVLETPFAVGDLNGDGKADLATGSGNVLLGNGDGTFQRPMNYAGALPLNSGSFVVLADVNGDGITDIAVGDGGSNIDVLLGNGDGTFRPGSAQANVPGLLGLLVGEFNGDGKTDFAALSGNTVEIVFGTNVSVTATGGTPQSTPINTPFPAPLQVTVKDGATPLSGVEVQFFTLPFQANVTLSSSTATTDANGVASVTATANSVTGQDHVTAASGLTAQFALTNLSGPASVMIPAPLTQSAQVGTAFTRLLEVTLMDPIGQPASGVTVNFAAPSSGASAVLSSTTAVTDANGTAGVMATANSIAGSYSAIASAPGLSATFAMTNRPPIATTATVALAASANPSTLGAPVTLTATISSPGANGRVTFFDGVTPLGTKTASAGTASLSTLLLASGVHKLTAYYRDETNLIAGSSNAVTETVKAIAGGAFTSAPNSTLFGLTSAVVAGDFNRDGKIDLAYLAYGGSQITVATGNGNGGFSTNFPTGSPYFTGLQQVANSLVTADFDGDGIPDFAVSTATGALSVLLGASSPAKASLYPATSAASPTPANSTSALAVGDFNGDGKPDLVYAYVANGPVTQGVPTYLIAVNLIRGAGDGALGFPIAYASLPASSVFPILADLKVADFNGDGKPDLAILETNGGLTIVLGNGDGTAQAPVFLSPSGLSLLYSLVVGDFNGDGKTDLAIGGAESTTATTIVLLGRGDGTFQSGAIYPSGAAALAGDFNGDGFTDLVVNDSLGNMQGILQGRGDGTFQQGLTFSAGIPLVVSDFNGDGKADIFVGTGATLLGATPVNNGSGPPASIRAGGTSQFAMAGGVPFTNPLSVTVSDANGMPVSGASVTFTVPTVGPSAALSQATVLTDNAGFAQVTATTNSIVGAYTVTAQVGGLSASFSLANVLGANLAQNRYATQSSTLPGAPGAGAAVDGNPDGNFYDRSVTATGLDLNAWWQVDLGASASVNTIYIFNRTDCCQARLSDYWIFISDTPFLPTDTPATLQNRAGTYANHQTTAPSPSNAISISATGRYVRVQLSGTDYLSLAEVEVAGSGGGPPVTNLAFQKPATQSSTFPAYASRSGYNPAAAGSAVDGNTDGNFFDLSVTATNADPNAWWQVDLGAAATISYVTIWNRTDCCGGRLGDYWVFISNTPFLPTDTPATLQNQAGVFASHQTVAPNPSVSIPVGVQGRYVRVQLSDTDYLSLAEVQVFGQ